ncbi:MAG: EAL domain-containing protein [Candidatus Fimadaptatus sp.]
MPLTKKQILIVEDNEINRDMLAFMISDEYNVIEAENGQVALDILARSWRSISLILLDVHMPVMDGYEFLERVKADAELSQIPVIVMTQGNSVEDELAALSRGATDFLPKPYHREVILHRVAGLIKLRETSAIVNDLQYDTLTGFYKKEIFCQKVAERLEEEPEGQYCIVGSNIENFKLINDSMGMREGDRLLKEIADTARRMLGDRGFCGRFGADRFLFFFEQDENMRGSEFEQNIRLEKCSPVFRNATMRCGVYEIVDRDVPVEKMCDRAFLAADRIKNQYGKFFSLYDDSLRSQLYREQAITAVMEEALREEQFAVYLQPKYSLKDQCMAGAEALVRWRHPQLGFVSPGEFIPLFEKNGFIPRLDMYVWEHTCAKLAEWQARGYPQLPVSINISRADILQGNLTDRISALVAKYGLDPACLHLEITESAYVANADVIIKEVKELRRRGFVVEMDDFGSGYASFNMLSRMTLDVLKLDIAFVQSELSKPADRSLIDDVIHMAHRGNMVVVAEGVETREQKDRLQDIGCDYCQGYFFAAPMPMDDYEALLARQEHVMAMTAAYGADSVSPASLLVVDDDAEYRQHMQETFADSYQVIMAESAQEAIARLDADGPDEVAAVILSLVLPDRGAPEVMKHLRQTPCLWNVPVLATIPSSQCHNLLPAAREADDFICKGHPLFDVQRRLQRLVDAAAFRRKERELLDEACNDPLTGVLNRRGFRKALLKIRKADMPIAMCIFDLDDLKNVNDSHGHDAGDRTLRAFAEHLGRNTRAEDIRCRYGGDEFILILKNVDSEESALKKCEFICSSFREKMGEQGLATGCSVGVSMCGEDIQTIDEWLKRADDALYQAKRENKGRGSIWQAEAE